MNIPIHLEEMDELKVIEYKIEMWLDKVQQYIEQPQMDQTDQSNSNDVNKIFYSTPSAVIGMGASMGKA